MPTTAADAAVSVPVVLKPPLANKPVNTAADAVIGPEAEMHQRTPSLRELRCRQSESRTC